MGEADPTGLAVHAIVRNTRTDRALDALRPGGSEVPHRLISAGELAAAVTEAPFRDAEEPDVSGVRAHEAVVESLLRRPSLVPAPYGFLARNEAAVRVFLERHRHSLEEALERLENTYEVRIHVTVGDEPDRARLAGHLRQLNGILRGQARAARELPRDSEEEAVAAFLVGRGEWLHLVQAATRWETRSPDVRLRITGPWPPYDFVRLEKGGAVIVRPESAGVGGPDGAEDRGGAEGPAPPGGPDAPAPGADR